MLKFFIIAITSIAHILSIADIADAKEKIYDRDLTNRSMAIEQTKSSSKSVLSKTDLEGIHQAIVECYVNANKEPGFEASGEVSFYEVKELRVLSFAPFDARVNGPSVIIESIENHRRYRIGAKSSKGTIQAFGRTIETVKTERVYNSIPEKPLKVAKIKIFVVKKDGKWNAQRYSDVAGQSLDY